MSFLLQSTLHTSIRCTGTGLHTGQKVNMTLHPAAENTGIIFFRSDIGQEQGRIRALYDRVTQTRLGTRITNTSGTSVGTIEHLMAALLGCGIDNVVVELDSDEVPIMDGSADPFVFLIGCAGVKTQEAPRYGVRVLKEVSCIEGDKMVRLSPHPFFEINYTIDFESKAIGSQKMSLRVCPTTFKTELSRARTFGFAHEIDQLRALGLARGGSLENAIVIEGDRILNEEGLRCETEFVRHKILDAMGDLYLCGHPLIGRYDGVKAGHDLNNRLLRALFAQDDAWEIIPLSTAAFSQFEAKRVVEEA